MSGKILIQNVKPLVIGRGSLLGSALTQTLVNYKTSPLTVDRKQPKALYIGEEFTRMNVADKSMFEKYLSKTPKIDSIINLAGIRKSYNYYLSYLISKAVLDKMGQNDINEFGCRGVIINLIYLASGYDEKYFSQQDDFAKEYEIDNKKIDDQVFELADQLTAARIRCNTIMVNRNVDPVLFTDLVKHILEDQYVSGQVINMEDNLRAETPSFFEFAEDIKKSSKPSRKTKRPTQPYEPPEYK